MIARGKRSDAGMRRTGKIISVALPATAVACAPSTAGRPAAAPATALPSASLDANSDLQALIAAAEKEGSVLVYDNVTIDAAMYEDGGVLVGQLMPRGVTRTWVPADLTEQIPAENHNPLLALSKATIFACNTELSPGGCPVKNVWDLTEPAWAGKLVMQDPLGKPTVLSFFTQLDAHGNAGLEQAYRARYGKALKTEDKNAAHEWIKRISLNKPVLTGSDEDISAAVGAPDATDRKIAFMSISKFRNNEDKGYHQAACEGMTPFAGFSYPKYVAIAAKSKHPNAAKLYVHFIMTEEGVKHEIGEGGVSANSTVKPLVTPPGLPDWQGRLFHTDPKGLLGDLQNRQALSDFWRVNRG
ncbi:ABC transporter substrate-binding protein [Nonomuraea rosea]|uniref:ABC transporter substrate-binding protein n=2 Tax=Nonomuraea rosea TaxID=638574 RepID=A0ABP6ZUZ7_9ACTN